MCQILESIFRVSSFSKVLKYYFFSPCFHHRHAHLIAYVSKLHLKAAKIAISIKFIEFWRFLLSYYNVWWWLQCSKWPDWWEFAIVNCCHNRHNDGYVVDGDESDFKASNFRIISPQQHHEGLQQKQAILSRKDELFSNSVANCEETILLVPFLARSIYIS